MKALYNKVIFNGIQECNEAFFRVPLEVWVCASYSTPLMFAALWGHDILNYIVRKVS